ncbi:lysophospholipid acyltransferase family protein [Paenibacillus physcomitrellae]|uniref:1-acyl-sn-glycerol-3-phosphate acyltransferase n=1 Tax=Paenibacillus physcomitrellae TaxID=1619311 RepID=A0ABQ1FNM5_9BACL|nr:lysophospholipid acyltransferase family protein [Paenibacillus physcomitrellae]GGA22937.1 1-acyl-sn-glycerol-3-phosphate acyltransferase [Paenibacillus physcomitrellae]
MIYSFCRVIVRAIYKLLFRFEAAGLEHVPQEGGVLLCSNHISNFDPPAVALLLKRKVHFMAKAELFEVPVFGKLITELGAFPVKRGGVSKESIKTSLKLLREGYVMGIFPEGTRKAAADAAVKKGAANFALRSGAAVVPVAIIGTYKLFRKVKVVYGPPVDLDEFRSDPSGEAVEAATERIMTSIRELKQKSA